MAAEDAAESEAEAAEESVFKEGFAGVGGTGGVKTATAGGTEKSVFEG